MNIKKENQKKTNQDEASCWSHTACSQKLPLDHEQHISICTPEVLITGEKPKNV